MSKLAAVNTGHSTQGIGAVPNGKHSHASPLEAQHAEAKAAGALLLEDLAAGPGSATAGPGSAAPDSSLPANSPRNHYAAVRQAAAATWLSLTATELEVRQHFRSIPVQTGLETLARMRKQCDMAAGELQQRLNEGNTERCTGCNKTLEECRKTQWLMLGADMDPDTGVPVPYRFCGPLCVRERNRKTMLPKDQRDKLRFDGQEEGEIR